MTMTMTFAMSDADGVRVVDALCAMSGQTPATAAAAKNYLVSLIVQSVASMEAQAAHAAAMATIAPAAAPVAVT